VPEEPADGLHDPFDDVTFTDEELTELALGATPFDPFGPDVERWNPVRRDRDSASPR
jgi:hypothetical protein